MPADASLHMGPRASGRMIEAATCPCCARPMFPKTITSVLRAASAPPPVLRMLRGLRGRVGVKGGQATAEWVQSWQNVSDTPEDIRPRLASIGARTLRNLIDYGWISETALLDSAIVKAAIDRAVSERRSDYRAPYSPSVSPPPSPPSSPARTRPTYAAPIKGDWK